MTFRQKFDGRDEFIEGFANRIEYDSVNSQLELIGQAQLRRGSDELRGAQISYNANTEFYKVVGQPDATNAGGPGARRHPPETAHRRSPPPQP